MSKSDRLARVAIIGCGYVGTALAEKLVANGCHVVGTTTSPQRVIEIEATGARAETVDVADAESIGNIIADRDVVYLTVAPGRRDADYRSVYLQAAKGLADALPQSSVRRVIYTSSTSVYGQTDGSWVDEDSPTEPESDNAKVLLETEQTLLQTTADRTGANLTVTIVRLGGIIGPGRELSTIASRFAGQTRIDGDAFVNLIHRDQIVDALVTLKDVDHHGVLNCAGDEPVRRRVLYDRALADAHLVPIHWQTPPSPINLGKRVRSRKIATILRES